MNESAELQSKIETVKAKFKIYSKLCLDQALDLCLKDYPREKIDASPVKYSEECFRGTGAVNLHQLTSEMSVKGHIDNQKFLEQFVVHYLFMEDGEATSPFVPQNCYSFQQSMNDLLNRIGKNWEEK